MPDPVPTPTPQPPVFTGGQQGPGLQGNARGFDSRIYQQENVVYPIAVTGNAGFPGVTGPTATQGKGYIASHGGAAAGGAGGTLAFLFFPSTVTVSRQVNLSSDNVAPDMRAVDDPTNPRSPMNATLSFTLLFDRTYEVWAGSTTGVVDDRNALYGIVGVGTGGGVMTINPVDVVFGTNGQSSPLHYYGYVASIEETYTHFSQTFVPMRCAIAITVQLFPDPAQ